MSFNFDKAKLPEVTMRSSWDLEDGTPAAIYQAGNWSFDSTEENDPSYAEKAIYAWIAWYNFIKK